MIKHAAIATALLALAAGSADAQGRGNKKGKVPPGHMPPAGQCRVWYDGVPPGRQPRPTSCAEAERTAARSGNARVIYRDGLEKGAEDASDRDSYDPNRHSWYRSADRGFESRYGTKENYQREYRRGFLEGYEAAYQRR